MSKFSDIIALGAEIQKAEGVEYTAAEIMQQPKMWMKTVEVLKNNQDTIKDFLSALHIPGGFNTRMLLSGAGTSEFIGHAVEGVMRKHLNVDVDSRASTDIITDYKNIFLKDRQYVVLSFARSGNSPESIGTFDLVKKKFPNARQIAITCNAEGKLAKAAMEDETVLGILLPEETNDKSLAMTSSFSSMAVAAIGLGFMNDINGFENQIAMASQAAEKIILESDKIFELAQGDWQRGVFLGSGPLYGTAREAHLKMSEMTEGRVMCRYDSFLGLRHGPQVLINDKTFVLAFVSSDPYKQRYEFELLSELKHQNKAGKVLVICKSINDELASVCDEYIELLTPGQDLHEDFRIMPDIVAGQLLGFFTSMKLGLKPDNPSTDGTINRVVQGVKVYDVETYEKTQEFKKIAG